MRRKHWPDKRGTRCKGALAATIRKTPSSYSACPDARCRCQNAWRCGNAERRVQVDPWIAVPGWGGHWGPGRRSPKLFPDYFSESTCVV